MVAPLRFLRLALERQRGREREERGRGGFIIGEEWSVMGVEVSVKGAKKKKERDWSVRLV